jgi:hypothetical protein
MPRDVERESSERAAERGRQGRRAAQPEDATLGRTPEVEPGVEWHAGEDAGEVPSADDAGQENAPARDERDAGDVGVTPA